MNTVSQEQLMVSIRLLERTFAGCRFENAILKGLTFPVTLNVEYSVFINCRFVNVDFSRSQFRFTHFNMCEFINCNFNDSVIAMVQMYQCRIVNSSFDDADIVFSSFEESNIESIENANITCSNFMLEVKPKQMSNLDSCKVTVKRKHV